MVPVSVAVMSWLVWSVSLALLYLGALFIAAHVPAVHRLFIFMSFATFPQWIQPLDRPLELGVLRCQNVRIRTPDGEELGGWVIHPKRQQDDSSSSSSSSSTCHITQRPLVVLYLHGNGGSRGQPWRRRLYAKLTSELHCTVVAFDYRGYGDSSGSPTEDGLHTDAVSMWTYVRHRFPSARIAVWGHSLGSAVAVRLVQHLQEVAVVDNQLPSYFVDGKDDGSDGGRCFVDNVFEVGDNPLVSRSTLPMALVLDGALTTIKHAGRAHWVSLPLRVPYLFDYLLDHVQERFDSIDRIATVAVPILFMHGDSDYVLPASMAQALHDAAVACKHKQVRWVAGAGHCDCASDPEVLVVTRAFLMSLLASEAGR